MRVDGRLTMAAALVASAAFGVTASAHRLDEYLQAARLDLAAERVSIELELTPGTELAAATLATIDSDGNGVVSENETQRYASDVVRDMQASLDGDAVPLHLVSSSMPSSELLLSGEGTIRLQASAAHPTLSAGTHRLRFTQPRLSDRSVYLANALVPEDAAVVVTGQQRDPLQRELTIDYTVRVKEAGLGMPGLLAGIAMVVAAIRLRTSA